MAPTGRGTTLDRLLAHLFGDRAPDALGDELREWLSSSPRFRSFADEHRDKIRKKLRGAADPESRRDVRAELRVAHFLLADRRIELRFEAYGAQVGGPDFTVTFRGDRPFNLEVKRRRGHFPGEDDAADWPVLAKLRQLPPSVPNAVLLAIDEGSATDVDTAGAARRLRARADAKDEAFFAARGFRDSRAFYERFLRLGAVFIWAEDAGRDDRAALWVNPSARIPLPQRAARASLEALRADG